MTKTGPRGWTCGRGEQGPLAQLVGDAQALFVPTEARIVASGSELCSQRGRGEYVSSAPASVRCFGRTPPTRAGIRHRGTRESGQGFGPSPAGDDSLCPQDDLREQPSAWIGQRNTPNEVDHEGAQGGWSTWIRHCCPALKRVAPPPHTLNRWRYEWIASWITHFLKPPTIRLPAPSATSASSIACGQWAECLQKPMEQTLSS